MGNLIDEIKAIKNSANKYYYSMGGIRDEDRNNKYEEYKYLINEYKKAVRWLRINNIEIDSDVK